jgi:glycosyltransferase involved in cell wall biosynthesis
MEVVSHARLAVIGNNPTHLMLESRFADLPIVFAGDLANGDLAAAYASSDLLILPSVGPDGGDDGDDAIVRQALASGLPVVAPYAGAAASYVVDGESGFLFEPGNLDEMVYLVRWLVSNPAHLRHLGITAWEDAHMQDWGEISVRTPAARSLRLPI